MIPGDWAGNLRVTGPFVFAILLLLAGCGTISRQAMTLPESSPPQATVADVPFYPQEEYQCGPAALAMALGWSGVAVKPAELTPEVYAPEREGSLQADLIGGARRHGRIAYPISGSEQLLAELAAHRPVIVLVNRGFFWYPEWHYAVAIGYDQPAGEIILHSGVTPHRALSYRVFDNLWQRSGRWGLLVLPPDVLPVNVREEDWLAAAVGLERAGQYEAAATAYKTALTRWPKSFGTLIGLGNSRYQRGELAGAAEAFRRAAAIRPADGLPYNNLAQALFELGREDEAIAAAKAAVERGGPLKKEFEQTLAEIEAKAAR